MIKGDIMKKAFYITLIIIILFLLAMAKRDEGCLKKPLNEAFQDSYCYKHWNRLYR